MIDFSKMCMHTITTKPWKLSEAVENYAQHGIGGVSVWQDSAQQLGARKSGDLIRKNGMEVVSYVRGGFFPHSSKAKRDKAIEDNKKMIDEAAELGAPMLVLVCGAEPAQDLEESRKQIQGGIESLVNYATQNKVQLTIEPLHPMYADTRSAINSLEQANCMAEAIDSKWVGVAVDVYHLWWDPNLEKEIYRCQEHGNFSAFHICDWNVPTTDLLLDRGLMGEGCIKLQQIKNWVAKSGFNGFHEVEIFSEKFWKLDQNEFMDKIVKSYSNYWES
ncbi:sugar phosphate isomerase/epimerase [Arenibacter sp. F26102]|uniref:sugar phosphate isomerase/epimerase family protein n=1 Tax=Arenibacter sp. F26102 TaxID=2926416 RepID=UPI001FF2272F|nr:sugar phosphate isomerase/epimerase family protein [Arenibacter sp. F26102]MCK0148042.1 sugar phosphate isomerase/epimerase [Arenibacter sp. F26102]